ncbi:MAG: hypothetical protein GXP46_03705 [Deferribacteres bacterium]|nr:hypothetical protein [Deferribacteres bacterium]
MKGREILRTSVLVSIVAVILTVIMCAGVVSGADEGGKGDSGDAYRVGISDVIDIRVMDHPDLRTVASVASDGDDNVSVFRECICKGAEFIGDKGRDNEASCRGVCKVSGSDGIACEVDEPEDIHVRAVEQAWGGNV